MSKDFASVYCLPFFMAALLIFFVFLYTLSRLKARGAGYLAFVCLAASFWSLSEGLLYLGLDTATKILVTQIQYFGIVPVPPLTLLLVLSIFDSGSRNFHPLRWLLLSIAAAIVMLVWTNPGHHLIFTRYYPVEAGAVTLLGLDHGPLWWAIIAYHYCLMAVTSVILLRQVFTAVGFQRAQAVVILTAVAAVWAANAVYATGHSPVANMDISPIAFSLVAGAMAWGFFRHNLLDVLPVARDEVFRGLEDAVVVFDHQHRVIDLNPAAEALLGMTAPTAAGGKLGEPLTRYPVLQRIAEDMRHSEVPIKAGGLKHVYDVRVSALTDRKGRPQGRIMVMRDITERKRAAEAVLESEGRYRQLFQLAPAGIFEVDYRSGRIINANHAMCEMLGYAPEEFIEIDALTLLTGESKARFLKRRDNANAGQPVQTTAVYTVLRKDGSELALSINTRFAYEGDVIVGETAVAQVVPTG